MEHGLSTCPSSTITPRMTRTWAWETAYFVELFDENHHLLGRLENGNTYPNESQRRFYLLKHPEAAFISVKRVYRRAF